MNMKKWRIRSLETAAVLRATDGALALSNLNKRRLTRSGSAPVPWHAMQLWRRSGRPTVVPAPEADLGPMEGGEIAVMLIDLAFGSPDEATSPCPRAALPTDEDTSRVPAGPALNFGGGDVTGASTLGEGADPLVLLGGVSGTSTTAPTVPFGTGIGGAFTGDLAATDAGAPPAGLAAGLAADDAGAPPVGIGFSFGGGVDGGGSGAGTGGGGGGMDCGGLQFGGG
eukprot:s2423_g3.t1